MDKYKFSLSIGFSGARQEETLTIEEIGFSQEDWDKYTPKEKEKALGDFWGDWSCEFIDGGFSKVEE